MVVTAPALAVAAPALVVRASAIAGATRRARIMGTRCRPHRPLFHSQLQQRHLLRHRHQLTKSS